MKLNRLHTKVDDIRGVLNTYSPDNSEDVKYRNLLRDVISEWSASILKRISEEEHKWIKKTP
ncbi:unnamed protein product [marine sediment metagenome]|uniref:Uncharacterized protein n=1 Tax=marine sediment metagenome TaxID=412755 RepID=X1CBL0_9ZZZZ